MINPPLTETEQYEQTDAFEKWLYNLDLTVRIKVFTRLNRIEADGNFGDHKHIHSTLYELRLNSFRIYCIIEHKKLKYLLLGGHKDTQQKDIEKAKDMLQTLNKK